MFDFALGFIAGSLIVAIVWKMLANYNIVIIKESSDGSQVIHKREEPTFIKPDNKKARHYSSPEYRAEMAFVKEQNSK